MYTGIQPTVPLHSLALTFLQVKTNVHDDIDLILCAVKSTSFENQMRDVLRATAYTKSLSMRNCEKRLQT